MIIFRLHGGLIILAVRPRPGLGNIVLLQPRSNIVVNELVKGLSSFLCEVVRFLVVGEIDATGVRDREYV